jgi:hypothetical protein
MSIRDEFSPETKRIIAGRAAYCCSNPECQAQTIGPLDDRAGVSNVGAACHIAAAAKGGPRYNESMTPEQRKHPDNGIWMCRTHADEIDDDEKRFTVDLLKTWKREAEERTRQRLGKAVRSDGGPVHFADLSTVHRTGPNTHVELADGTQIMSAKTYAVTRRDLDMLCFPRLTFRFLIAKSVHVPSIMLYGLQAVVYKYEGLPKGYKTFMYAYPNTVFPYILDLEKPVDDRRRPCPANFYWPRGESKPLPFTPLVINDDVPQVIDVLFTAPESGVYTFALDAVITSGVDRHTFRVSNPAPVLFEKIG